MWIDNAGQLHSAAAASPTEYLGDRIVQYVDHLLHAHGHSAVADALDTARATFYAEAEELPAPWGTEAELPSLLHLVPPREVNLSEFIEFLQSVRIGSRIELIDSIDDLI